MRRLAFSTAMVMFLLVVCAAIPAVASGTVTITVTESGSPVSGAFVALTGPEGQFGAVSDDAGQAAFTAVPDGEFVATASAPGTTVGSQTVTVSGGDATATVTVADSGNRFQSLGAYGAQVGQIIAGGAPGVFYLTTTSVPSLYRTGDYGGHWAPVTISTDDPLKGLDGTTNAMSVAASGFPGEVVAVVGNGTWYSRDFGVTWTKIGVSVAPGNGTLQWGHVGATSVLFSINTSGVSTEISYTEMPTIENPSVVPSFHLMSASYRATAADRVWVANGSASPFFAVAAADGSTVTLYAVDSTPSNSDPSNVASLAGTTLAGGHATFVRVGGGIDGPAVGDGNAPDTILVYSNDGTGSAAMLSWADVEGTPRWVGTTSTVFHNQESDGVSSGGGYNSGPSSCAGQPGAVGSVSPLGAAGTVAMCWVTQEGTTLDEFHVRPVSGINNNTSMAFDAGYDGRSNRVMISGDGGKGAAKSAMMNPALNRPSFPQWPVLAAPGIGQDSGGVAVEGIDAAVVKDTAYGPAGANQVAVMMSFSGGGRTLGSVDGGQTWITIHTRGGGSIDWWASDAGANESWILAGSGGDGDLLAAADVPANASTPTDLPENALVFNRDRQGLERTTATDLGITGVPGMTSVSAVVGIPGTTVAYVGTSASDEGTLRRVTLSGTRSSVPDSRAAAIAAPGNIGTIARPVVALDYCPADGSAPQVADVLYAAIASTQSTTGGIMRITGASGGSPTMTQVATGDFNDVRVQCDAGEVWAGREASGSAPLIHSTDGVSFSSIPIPSNPPLNGVETLTPTDNPAELVAVGRDGDIAITQDDGANWVLANNAGSEDGRSFGAEAPGDIELPPEPVGPQAIEPASAQGVFTRNQASVTSAEQEPLLGTGSGLFGVDVLSIDATPPSVPSITTPALFQGAKTYTIQWSASSDPQSGVYGYFMYHRRMKFNSSSWTYDAAAWVAGTRVSVTAATGYLHCYRVRAYNYSGLLSALSAEKCTVVAADDREMSTGGFVRKTATGYYLNTYSISSTRGHYLRLPVTSAKRIYLIATKCPTCGTVEVLLGTRVLARVSLYRATAAKKQFIPIIQTGCSSGTVTVRIYSSGKPVIVEGMAASRI